jgi:hypothetical protein
MDAMASMDLTVVTARMAKMAVQGGTARTVGTGCKAQLACPAKMGCR